MSVKLSLKSPFKYRKPLSINHLICQLYTRKDPKTRNKNERHDKRQNLVNKKKVSTLKWYGYRVCGLLPFKRCYVNDQYDYKPSPLFLKIYSVCGNGVDM